MKGGGRIPDLHVSYYNENGHADQYPWQKMDILQYKFPWTHSRENGPFRNDGRGLKTIVCISHKKSPGFFYLNMLYITANVDAIARPMVIFRVVT